MKRTSFIPKGCEARGLLVTTLVLTDTRCRPTPCTWGTKTHPENTGMNCHHSCPQGVPSLDEIKTDEPKIGVNASLSLPKPLTMRAEREQCMLPGSVKGGFLEEEVFELGLESVEEFMR